MKKAIVCILLAAAIGCFGGCASEQEGTQHPTETQTQPSAEPQAPVQNEKENFEELQRLGGSTEEGFYCLDAYNNNLLLCYIDYSQNQEIVLCSRPECTHSDSSCTAYFLVEQIQMAPAIFTFGDSLLLVQPQAGENSLPHLARANLDGTEYKEIASFPANTVLDARLFGGGNSVYLICEKVTEGENAELTYQLISVDCSTGESEVLHEFEKETSMIFFEDAYNDHLILEEVETNGARAFLSYNVAEKRFEEPIFRFRDTTGIALTAQGKSYTVDKENKIIRQTDLVSGEASEIEYGGLQSEMQGTAMMEPWIFHTFGSWYRLDFINTADFSGEQNESFLLNFETGEHQRHTLVMPYNGEAILILAEQGDRLLVQADWQVEGGANPQIEVRYAMITKEDYLNSEPNYLYIEKDF